MVSVDHLRNAIEAEESGWRVTTIDGWTVDVVVDEPLADGDPAYDKIVGAAVDGVWDEGWVDVACFATCPPDDWATGYCAVTSTSKDGEWQGVRLHFGTEFDESEGHPSEQFDASAGVASIDPIPRWMVEMDDVMREYHDEALENVEAVRSKTVRRVVMAVACVRCAAFERRGDVWAAYEREADVASLSGFAGWLTEPRLRELLMDEFGKSMWPDRVGDLEVGGRGMLDVLHGVRYIVELGGGGESLGDEDGGVEDEVDEQEEGEDVEVTFEPADG